MDLFLTFFGGKPVPPQVDKFTCFFPSPFSAPSRAVVVAPLSSLARQRPPLPAAVVVAPLSSLARRRPPLCWGLQYFSYYSYSRIQQRGSFLLPPEPL
jgi:hypothetical protein